MTVRPGQTLTENLVMTFLKARADEAKTVRKAKALGAERNERAVKMLVIGDGLRRVRALFEKSTSRKGKKPPNPADHSGQPALWGWLGLAISGAYNALCVGYSPQVRVLISWRELCTPYFFFSFAACSCFLPPRSGAKALRLILYTAGLTSHGSETSFLLHVCWRLQSLLFLIFLTLCCCFVIQAGMVPSTCFVSGYWMAKQGDKRKRG